MDFEHNKPSPPKKTPKPPKAKKEAKKSYELPEFCQQNWKYFSVDTREMMGRWTRDGKPDQALRYAQALLREARYGEIQNGLGVRKMFNRLIEG